MNSFWLTFQGSCGDAFSNVFAFLPGSDLTQLIVFSVVLGILLIWLYRFVSFQKQLLLLKKKIATTALEPFLFADSARISLFTPLRLAVLAGKYMALSVPPLLLLAVPVIWLLGLWNQVIGYSELRPGQQVVVNILAEKSRDIRQLQVEVEGNGFTTTPLVRSYPEAQAWLGLRRAEGAGINDNTLLIKVGSDALQIPLSVFPVLPVITASSWNRLLFPGSNLKIPAGIREISIDYPARYFEISGINIPWVVLFLIVSMISGLVFAKILHIQI